MQDRFDTNVLILSSILSDQTLPMAGVRLDFVLGWTLHPQREILL